MTEVGVALATRDGRTIHPEMLSRISTTFSFAIGCQKLGQPVPESNLVSELKRALSQQMHRKRPLSCRFQESPEEARSVPALRVTSKEIVDNWCFHCSSVLIARGTATLPVGLPAAEKATTA